jgi:integrase
MSLHKQLGKPNWLCAYTIWDPETGEGRRVFRSTGTSNKKQALEVERAFKKMASKARDGTLNAYTARQLIAEAVDSILHALSPEQREAKSKSRYTIKAWMEKWLESKKNEVEPSTLNRYKCVIDRFVAFLGTKSNHDIAALDSRDVLEFRDDEAKTLARETANLAVRVLRTCFGDAMKQNLNYGNPAVGVKMLKGSKESRRRAFTLDEIKRILKACEHDEEWYGLVIFGLYLGQRLGDLAKLTWRAVNLDTGEISFTTRKTGRRINIPMMQPVLDYLTTLPANDNPNAFIFPDAAKHKYVASLSGQFREILIDAGLAEVRDYGSHLKKQNPLRSREVSEISFHSLRHSAVTLLKAAGVSDFIAREIVGHDSAAVSRQYSHLSTEHKRNAMRNLPDVTA